MAESQLQQVAYFEVQAFARFMQSHSLRGALDWCYTSDGRRAPVLELLDASTQCRVLRAAVKNSNSLADCQRSALLALRTSNEVAVGLLKELRGDTTISIPVQAAPVTVPQRFPVLGTRKRPGSPLMAAAAARRRPATTAASSRDVAPTVAVAAGAPIQASAARVMILRRTLSALDSASELAKAVDSVAQLVTVLRERADQGALSSLLCELDLHALPDVAVLAITERLELANLRQRCCLIFVQEVLCRKVMSLAAPASRQLLQATLAACKAAPRPTAEALLVPILVQPAESLGSAQCEVASRLLREGVPSSLVPQVFEQLLGGEEEGGRNDCARMVWSDLTIPVIQGVLNMRLPFGPELFALLVSRIEEAASGSAALAKSVKFGAVVFAVVTKYAEQATRHVAVLRQVLSKCGGKGLAKSAALALTKAERKAAKK